MSIVDLYTSGAHRKNVAHFASLVSLATVDGVVDDEELEMLIRFAHKLDVTEVEYKDIIENGKKYVIEPNNNHEERLERLYDFLRLIFSDHFIDSEELDLLNRYAIGIGYDSKTASDLIKRSIDIFGGKISFEDYKKII